jgi:Ca-activated chloride channel family protein
MKKLIISFFVLFTASKVFCAGLLIPVGSGEAKPVIKDHSVDVSIIANFAATRVTQTFYNPGNSDLEAVYHFPLPEDAALSEVTVVNGETLIEGEVVSREEANRIYGVEKEQGNNTALAEKNSYQDFRFYIANIRAQSEVTVTFVYYQPLEIDTKIGRYVYPLQEGGTDESARNFWTVNSKVEGSIRVNVDCRAAYPLATVRTPGNRALTSSEDLTGGNFSGEYELEGGALDKDFVFYYRFEDSQPARLEVIPYRDGRDGTFMAVLTPGVDLKPITNGADYIFVLDISGSMEGKIATLAKGVARSLGELSDRDRFRIVVFDNNARELTSGFVSCTGDNVAKYSEELMHLSAGSSTDLYKGMSKGLDCIEDDDRVTSVILVTDAVANSGVINPSKFYELMKRYDVRVFGFLMGNSGNWPLMRVICDGSGGFYKGVSNDDDIIGQILLAKNKITHEALHDVKIWVKGGDVYDMSSADFKKVYHGEQLVVFGKYKKGGKSTITMEARLSGEDKTYKAEFNLPHEDKKSPEIERLYGVFRIKLIEDMMSRGEVNEEKGRAMIKNTGLEYQIVTDETSMIVLPDEKFEEYKIARKNRERLKKEKQAKSERANAPADNYRVDSSDPMFSFSAPSMGGGGGAVGPFALIFAGVSALASFIRKKKK